MGGLSKLLHPWQHNLTVAVLFEDYFEQRPVEEELQVALERIDGFSAAPVQGIDGGRRQADGTYRFADVPSGTYDIGVVSNSGQWASFAALPRVTVDANGPTGNRSAPLTIPLWPTPTTPFHPGRTIVRGKLQDGHGAPLSGLTVQLFAFMGARSSAGSPFTRTDPLGEFYFALTSSLAPDPSDGLVGLQIAVEYGRVPVGGGEVREGLDARGFTLNGAPSSASDEFFVSPGGESRIVFYANEPA
jgi:hypothetical protein